MCNVNRACRTIKKWYKKHKLGLFVLFLFLFPLIVGVIYSLPLPQYVAVESGDLLAFYGVAFGLLFSFVTYLDSNRKISLERQKNMRPEIYVELEQRSYQSGVFDIHIRHNKKQVLTDVYLYDELVCGYMDQSKSFAISYCLNQAQEKGLCPDFNITMDSDILDVDGFPKYIQIVCYDTDDNGWVCEFNKAKVQNKIMYIPLAPQIV